jgi:hypothetical protein
LQDQNSDKRLYFANKNYGDNSIYNNKNEFALILLNQEQRNLWKDENNDVDIEMYFLSTEIHDNRFNTKNIEKIIQEYEKIGLFFNLSEAEIEKGRENIKNKEIDNYFDILLCFPKQVMFFGWEVIDSQNPYKNLLLEFSKVSKGKFIPKNIKDSFEEDMESMKDSTDFSFDFNGKNYEISLLIDGYLLDLNFIDFIKNTLKENNIDEKLYLCEKDEEAASYIFLSNSQYEYLSKNQPELFQKN